MPFPQRPDSPQNPSRLHGSFGAPYFLYDLFRAGTGGAPIPPPDCQLMLQEGGFLLLQDGTPLGLMCVDFIINPMPGNCDGVSDASDGNSLAGMTVQATFQDMSTETATWVSTGASSGNAVGTNWSVSESGDTSSGTWTITNNSGNGILALLFDACPANSVFNTTFGTGKTAGTGTPLNFIVTGGTFTGIAQATYLSPAGLNNAAPLGDIYRQLLVQFPLVDGNGMTSGTTVTFQQDTDGCITCSAMSPLAADHACESINPTSNGSTLAGATVTVTFADTTTETATWVSTGAQSGSVTGTGWSITEDGDTIFNSFFMTNSSGQGITQLVFDLTGADAIFDTTLGSSKTPGTDAGQTFSVSGGTYTGTVDFLYSGLVALPRQTPRGDLFTTLTLDFVTAGGLPTGQTIDWLADTDGCVNFGGFGPTDTANLIWHVECEFRVYTDLNPLTPPNSGDAVVLWGDLVGSNDLTPTHVPPDTGSQVTNYQTNATTTGRPNIQVGTDWRAVFGGNFNFFTATGQWSYAVFYRSASTHIALIDDGTPFTNGFAFGYGVGNLDTTGSGSTHMGIKDGAAATEDTAIGRLIISAMVVTYDGQNGGATNYYVCRPAIPGPGFTFDSAGPFNNVGLTATGGFGLGGTYQNSDPNRLDTSLSLCEAAAWTGILSLAQIQEIADRCGNYWGYT